MALSIEILAGGRAKAAPETELALSYLARARDAGRPVGFTTFALTEVDERKPDKMIEACRATALVIALDEHGKSLTSETFAKRLAAWRDAGESRVLFVIGGADGLPEKIRKVAHATIAFGAQTWPHLLVRTMVAEQIYRAMTILSGHPYHRA